MSKSTKQQPIQLLLIEDSAGDILLTQRAFKKADIANAMDVVRDGEEALSFLRKEGEYKGATRPDLILLDLNIPGKSGMDTLKEIKGDDNICSIPVIMLSSSEADSDVEESYKNYASGYVVKPLDGDKFLKVVESIEGFWFATATLPPKE
jgi:CheY-like chemotaxis protein